MADVGIRIPYENGFPRQSADWLAMTNLEDLQNTVEADVGIGPYNIYPKKICGKY